tara:strand:+ start:128 stop:385 length:258 start_codon:yes stop_codon:yes gene_type:complete
MTAGDRFMKKIEDFYDDLGYPVVWDGEGSKRQLEITFKSESGYFVKAVLLARGNDIVIKDEWGREQVIKATRGNLQMIKSWSEHR